MNIKSISFVTFGAGFTALSFLGFSSCKEKKSKPPNFLIILVDDLGSRDIGPYGQEYIQTPNIDLLAAEGMLWTNAYSSCPVCSPTRVALLTGKNQARVGFTGHITAINRHRHPENSRIIPPDDLMNLPHDEIILAEALKPAGYTSISIGKWHVGSEGHWPTDMGFDYNIAGHTRGAPPSYFFPYKNPKSSHNPDIKTLNGGEPGEYLTDRLTDEAVSFIHNYKNKPFLLYLSHYAVHTPLEAPRKLTDKYKTIVAGTSIDPVYAAMVESVDRNVGRLLQVLEELDLSDNTVVILASDNGALKEKAGRKVSDLGPFREQKGHLYEGGIRVPLIIRWPGFIKPGSFSDNPTISEDIYATIVDIAGGNTKPNKPLDGRSLIDDFDGQIADSVINLQWYYPHYSPHGNKPGAAIRSGSFKLIEFYDPPEVELYNLKEDIGETNNLSDSLPGLKETMLTNLHKWIKEVDPVLHSLNPDYTNNME